jgi:hypothetical protein
MRRRLIAAFVIASSLVAGLLASTATFVFAVERNRAPAPPPSFEVQRHEAPCDVLRREIHALSHRVARCDLTPECQGSPLLCPMAQDVRIEREYERLRDALHEQCGLSRSLLDFAWQSGAQFDVSGDCFVAHDGFEAALRGESAPTSYSF